MKRPRQPSVKKEKQQQQQPPRKKPSAAALFASPPQQPPIITAVNINDDTPKCFKFTVNSSPQETPPAVAKLNTSSSRKLETVSSLSELKELASSRLESMKRQTERSHSDIVKEVDSTHSRLNKRYKIQTQACQKLTDETDKEFKKMMERITESCEAMKGSYSEFQVEAQTTHSRACKTSIPEKVQYFEDAINAFRSRYVTS